MAHRIDKENVPKLVGGVKEDGAGKVYTSGQEFSKKFVDSPLDVVRYDGELYSLCNRRHTAFSVAQATLHMCGSQLERWNAGIGSQAEG